MALVFDGLGCIDLVHFGLDDDDDGALAFDVNGVTTGALIHVAVFARLARLFDDPGDLEMDRLNAGCRHRLDVANDRHRQPRALRQNVAFLMHDRDLVVGPVELTNSCASDDGFAPNLSRDVRVARQTVGNPSLEDTE